MNVKFRMPKLFGNQKFQGTFKELTLSIVGTTISILLTFGTAAVLEHRQQEKNRRMIALMVISDIYDFEGMLRGINDGDFANWQRDIKELQTLSQDSILRLTKEQRDKYWTAISTPMSFSRDKTAQNLFSSDMSTWRDVRNLRFIKLVGQTYSEIDDIEKNVKVKMDEKSSNNNLFMVKYDTENMSGGEQMVAYLEMKEVQRFMLDFCYGFRPYLQNYADRLHNSVNECMEIMGISQEELDDFIINNSK